MSVVAQFSLSVGIVLFSIPRRAGRYNLSAGEISFLSTVCGVSIFNIKLTASNLGNSFEDIRHVSVPKKKKKTVVI